MSSKKEIEMRQVKKNGRENKKSRNSNNREKKRNRILKVI